MWTIFMTLMKGAAMSYTEFEAIRIGLACRR